MLMDAFCCPSGAFECTKNSNNTKMTLNSLTIIVLLCFKYFQIACYIRRLKSFDNNSIALFIM